VRNRTLLRYDFYKTQRFKKQADLLNAWNDIDVLKLVLDKNPNLGDVIPGGEGLRKVRMPLSSKSSGKRGGARVLYYQVTSRGYFLLVYLYAKSDIEDLKKDELDILVQITKATLEQIERLRREKKPHEKTSARSQRHPRRSLDR
jgi:hypothetical protein